MAPPANIDTAGRQEDIVPPRETAASRYPWLNYVAALIIMGAFLYFTKCMFDQSGTLAQTEQYRWDRAIIIYNAIQTMAVAAAGVLLGTTVQQARVETAQAQTNKAEGEAKANAGDAAKADAARKLIGTLNAPGGGGPPPTLAQVAAILR